LGDGKGKGGFACARGAGEKEGATRELARLDEGDDYATGLERKLHKFHVDMT
jgi:hypothetical protein